MPYTLAHPAAVLPLRGVRYLRTAPLFIGAMVPDARDYVPSGIRQYLVRMHEWDRSYSTCLLLGCAVFVAVFVLRRPLTVLLSARARWLCLNALAPFSDDPVEWLFAPFAILLGIWTHLLWDSFTHTYGVLVRDVTWLRTPVNIGWYHGMLYHVLQYVSSAFGLVVLAWWYSRLRTPPLSALQLGAQRPAVGPGLALVAGVALFIGGVKAADYFAQTGSIYWTTNVLLTRAMAWFVLLNLVAGSIVMLYQRHEGG